MCSYLLMKLQIWCYQSSNIILSCLLALLSILTCIIVRMTSIRPTNKISSLTTLLIYTPHRHLWIVCKMKLILSIWMLVLVSCVAADGLTPAQHQYNALHNEIIDFRDSPDCKVLTQAAYAVDPITNPLKYALTTGEKAIAKGLVSEYKEAKPDGFMIGTRFDNLFKKHITDPCSKIMELSKRLETLVNANAELEDFRGYPQAPFGFTEQICSHLNEKKYKRTFEEFKKQLKQ